MPTPTLISPPPSLCLSPQPLTPEAFAPFGTVILSPLPRNSSTAPTDLSSLPLPHKLLANPVLANQGSAVKTSPISPLDNGYDGVCPSGKKAQARMSMFSCFPRILRYHHTDGPVFDVRILERHPFTTQTFIPIDLSSQKRVLRDRRQDAEAEAEADAGNETEHVLEEEEKGVKEKEPVFLVLVAPTLKGQSAAAIATTSTTSDAVADSQQERVSIRDPPDLEHLKAFIARGGHAVTYGPGTWHAPMAVLGRRRIDFVVVQFVNGVDEEDCQEVAFRDGISVRLGSESFWYRKGLMDSIMKRTKL